VRANNRQSRNHVGLDVRKHRCFILIDGEREHVYIDLEGDPLRLDVIEGSVLQGPATIEAVVDIGEKLQPQITTLQRVDRLLRGLDTPSLDDRRLPRLVLALRALDAKIQGASLRTIARDILRTDDWPGDGECVKSSARRLIGLGQAMARADPTVILSGRSSFRPSCSSC
jgi:hypothetical protein